MEVADRQPRPEMRRARLAAELNVERNRQREQHPGNRTGDRIGEHLIEHQHQHEISDADPPPGIGIIAADEEVDPLRRERQQDARLQSGR